MNPKTHSLDLSYPSDGFTTLTRALAPWARPIALALVALMSVLHFWDLDKGSLHPWDESMYALRAKIALQGQWLDQMPYCYGPPYSADLRGNGFYSGAFPPLLVWAIALSMKLFGVTEFAVRFPPALAGAGCVWLMYLWGRVAFGRATGVWAAFTLASWFLFIKYARRGQFDVPVVFFMTLLFYCGMRYYRAILDPPSKDASGPSPSPPRAAWPWLVAAGIALGLGLMTKIVICGFASVSLFLFAAALWTVGRLPLRRVIVDAVVVNGVGLAIAAPWHLHMLFKYRAPGASLLTNNAFWDIFWGYHIGRRSSEALETHGHDWYYYFELVLKEIGMVWSVVLAFALVWALWRAGGWLTRGWRDRLRAARRGQTDTGWTEDVAVLAPVLWFVFVYGLSQATTSKREVYLFPFTPPMVLLTARFLMRMWNGVFSLRAQLGFMAATLTATIFWRAGGITERAVAWLGRHRSTWPERLWGVAENVWPIALAVIAITAVAAIVIRRHRGLWRLPVTVAMACVLAVGFRDGLRQSFRRKSVRDYDWSVVGAEVAKGGFDTLIFMGQSEEPDLSYYLDGINLGARKNIRFRYFMRDTPWLLKEVKKTTLNLMLEQGVELLSPQSAAPLETTSATLVVVQRYREKAPRQPVDGLQHCFRDSELARLLAHCRRVASNRDFEVWRGR